MTLNVWVTAGKVRSRLKMTPRTSGDVSDIL